MVPLALLAIPIFFAKEVFSNDVENTLNCMQPDDDTNDDDYDSSTTGVSLSLTSSSVSSSSSSYCDGDDISIDESYVDEASHVQLCSLLGPRVLEDEQSIRSSNTNTNTNTRSKLPPNLHDSVVIQLPVGFYRLRRSFLSKESRFWTESILKIALHYQEVRTAGWEHTSIQESFLHVGDPNPPRHVNPSDFVGAQRETSYLMPAGRLVGASTAYETATITAYDADFFALTMSTSTPGVPFGKRFSAKTQIVVVNTGDNSCELICSVEPEFPNGPPMGMKGQIQRGMKRGTIDMFEKIGSHIRNCAVSYGWC